MIIRRSTTFKKQYKKLPFKFQTQFDERLMIFINNPTDSRLYVHPLKGKLDGYWSMSVSGDIRALFKKEGNEIIIFAFIGTHSQLYG